LFAVLSLRNALIDQQHTQTTPLLVRIGINLGPAKLVKDINGQLNIIGDGINVAQRAASAGRADRPRVSEQREQFVR